MAATTSRRSARTVKGPERFGMEAQPAKAATTRRTRAKTGAGIAKTPAKTVKAKVFKNKAAKIEIVLKDGPRRRGRPPKTKAVATPTQAPSRAAIKKATKGVSKPATTKIKASTADAQPTGSARYPSRKAAQEAEDAAMAAAAAVQKAIPINGVTPADQIMGEGWAPTAELKAPRLPPKNESPLKDLAKRKAEAEQRRARAERRASGLMQAHSA